MMHRDGFVWNKAGYAEANKSAKVTAEVARRVQAITARANAMLPVGCAPFVGDVQEGKTRAQGKIKAPKDDTPEAFKTRKLQAEQNLLLKAAGGIA